MKTTVIDGEPIVYEGYINLMKNLRPLGEDGPPHDNPKFQEIRGFFRVRGYESPHLQVKITPRVFAFVPSECVAESGNEQYWREQYTVNVMETDRDGERRMSRRKIRTCRCSSCMGERFGPTNNFLREVSHVRFEI